MKITDLPCIVCRSTDVVEVPCPAAGTRVPMCREHAKQYRDQGESIWGNRKIDIRAVGAWVMKNVSNPAVANVVQAAAESLQDPSPDKKPATEVLSDEAIDKAVEYLTTSAEAAAKARAERAYLEQYRKSLKATLMQEHNEQALGVQEREAYADPRYTDFLKVMRLSVEEDEKCRFLREAASAKIEAWRTMNANMRAVKI